MHMGSRKISVPAISTALVVGEPDVGTSSVRTSDAALGGSVLELADPSRGTRIGACRR
jgi:hypothetical protein